MDEMKILTVAMQEAPTLVVLCFLVYVFLKHLKDRDTFIRGLQDEHLAAREESKECIRDNTKSNRELIDALAHLRESCRDQMMERHVHEKK